MSASLFILVVLAVLLLYQMYFYIRYIGAPYRQACRKSLEVSPLPQTSELDLFARHQEGVSVIVCAKNEEENIRDYLHTLLEQNYPLYEVIVVNDGSRDGTQAVIDDLTRRYAKLRCTFVPVGADVKSTKKLALTLGIKAAKYDLILLTDADCRPENGNWINSMAQQAQGKEFVLGYGAYFQTSSLLNRLIQYDTLFNALQYMGFALNGRPYMGVGRNLMYRKSLFMKHHGFAGVLDQPSGDDDLFVNRYATAANTAVAVQKDSVTWSVPKKSLREWFEQKHRHLSVSGLYSFKSKWSITLEPVSRALWYGMCIVAVVWGVYWPVVVSLMLIRFITRWTLLNLGAKKMQAPAWGLDIIIYDIVLPLITLFMLMRKKPQTWKNKN